MALISCDKISKYYRRSGGSKLLREHLGDMTRGPEPDDRFYALRDVSFEVNKGESVGIIGRNGAGKSTLLNIITGLTGPDEGTVRVNGTVAALLELGAGFHPDLTGRENLEIYASLVGLTRAETVKYRDEIVAFSELHDFMEEPIRTYSSGMIIRLAFAVAVHRNSEIFIVDEVLAVGDAAFQNKCVDRIRSMHTSGQSLLFVTHSPGLVQEFCKTALWLDQGRVMRYGPSAEVCAAYHEFLQLEPPIPAAVSVAPAPKRRKVHR